MLTYVKYNYSTRNNLVCAVSISMIPEAISYAVIAGLPPSFALQSCWISCIMTAIIGGRPGMITSASGLSALLLYRLVSTETIGATSIMFVPLVVSFAGILQTFSAFFGFGKLASNFPAPMIVGMVNGLAILAFALQMRYAKVFPLNEADMSVATATTGGSKAVEVEWTIALFSFYGKGLEFIQPWLNFGVYLGEVVLAFIVTMFIPKLTTFFPATLMAMLVVVAVEYGLARQFGADTPLLGDYGGVEVRFLYVKYCFTCYCKLLVCLPFFRYILIGTISLDYRSQLGVRIAFSSIVGNLEDCLRIWLCSFCHSIYRNCDCAQRCQSIR